jgi:hypothetical protein
MTLVDSKEGIRCHGPAAAVPSELTRGAYTVDKTHGGLPLTVGQGVVAGLLAGLVMSIWEMSSAMLLGAGLWKAPLLIATIVLGPQVYDGGRQFAVGPVMLGLLLHELASAGMGLAYVPLVHIPLLGRHPIITAVLYAFVSWIVAQYALIPWLSPTMAQHTPPLQLAIAHIVFGVVLGLSVVWTVQHQRRRAAWRSEGRSMRTNPQHKARTH